MRPFEDPLPEPRLGERIGFRREKGHEGTVAAAAQQVRTNFSAPRIGATWLRPITRETMPRATGPLLKCAPPQMGRVARWPRARRAVLARVHKRWLMGLRWPQAQRACSFITRLMPRSGRS